MDNYDLAMSMNLYIMLKSICLKREISMKAAKEKFVELLGELE